MKIIKYIIYYICVIILHLGYWGFVKLYYNSFPIYKYSILDYLSALGLFVIIYITIDKIRKNLLKILNI